MALPQKRKGCDRKKTVDEGIKSFSTNDGNDNKNVKKAAGLISQNNISTRVAHFSALTARVQR